MGLFKSVVCVAIIVSVTLSSCQNERKPGNASARHVAAAPTEAATAPSAHTESTPLATRTADAGTVRENGSDTPRIIRYLEKRCSNGESQACEQAAMEYVYGGNIDKDLERGLTLRYRACKMGEANSCRLLRSLLRREAKALAAGFPSQDKLKALGRKNAHDNCPLDPWERHQKEKFSLTAKQRRACLWLSQNFKQSKVISRDESGRAKRVITPDIASTNLLFSMCDIGVADACHVYAQKAFYAYEETSADGDLEIAHEYWRLALEAEQQACAGGDAEACLRLASTYRTGDKNKQVAPDKTAAESYYRQAGDLFAKRCEAGRLEVCEKAGDKLSKQAPPRARAMYERACKAGVKSACKELQVKKVQ
ncbi:MAG: hypothetical protein MJE77_41875 [Proteobacteria bacterium]|nr:hypothetical protein [Pseudomonadota bacterium]